MCQPTKFISYLYEILDNSSENDPIQWTNKGKSFIIIRIPEFLQILKEYFEISQLDSFLRQLRFYGFKMFKNNRGQKEYSHKYFYKGSQFLLHRIQRKQIIKNIVQNEEHFSYFDETEDLEYQLQILKNNQQILLDQIKISTQIHFEVSKMLHQVIDHFYIFHLHTRKKRDLQFRTTFFKLLFGYNYEQASDMLKILNEEMSFESTPKQDAISPLIFSKYLFN